MAYKSSDLDYARRQWVGSINEPFGFRINEKSGVAVAFRCVYVCLCICIFSFWNAFAICLSSFSMRFAVANEKMETLNMPSSINNMTWHSTFNQKLDCFAFCWERSVCMLAVNAQRHEIRYAIV